MRNWYETCTRVSWGWGQTCYEIVRPYVRPLPLHLSALGPRACVYETCAVVEHTPWHTHQRNQGTREQAHTAYHLSAISRTVKKRDTHTHTSRLVSEAAHLPDPPSGSYGVCVVHPSLPCTHAPQDLTSHERPTLEIVQHSQTAQQAWRHTHPLLRPREFGVASRVPA